MKYSKKPLPVLKGITISDIAAEGKALARVNDLVVFVPWAAPGDVVDVQLTRRKNSYAEGKIVHFHHCAAERTEPFCEHFTVCGGCQWQHIPYPKQLQFKQKQVIDQLLRIGKIQPKEVMPILGSEQLLYYRNKLEYTFSNRRWLTSDEINASPPADTFTVHANVHDTTACDQAGWRSPIQHEGAGFHVAGKFDKVLDIRKCWLQDDISNRIRLFIKDFCLKHGYPFFDLRKQTGFIRTLIVRTSTSGELMIIVVFFEDDNVKREHLLTAVKTNFPEITALLYVINIKCNDTITDLDVLTFSGKDHLMERMEDLLFKIGPKSFFQTNSRQAGQLYAITRQLAGLTGNETVYDLYSGTGTIALFLARHAKKVIGIEYVPEAIEDAKVNAKLNNLTNVAFFAGDMRELLTAAFINEQGQPDVIITDPPRSGMHDDVVDAILSASPQRIVYVSCNPATQARDLSRLSVNYCIGKVQAVDMFPYTQHVENIALLELNVR